MDDHEKALLNSAIAAARAGQREQARTLLLQVVERDERNALAWLWLSGVVDSLDDREVCLENVLSLDPSNEAAHKGLAAVRRQQAERSLRDGIAAAQAGERTRAQELLERAVELNGQNALAWLWLSGVVGDLNEQAACLRNVLSLDPSNEAARKGLVIVRQKKAALPSDTSSVAEPPVAEHVHAPPAPAVAILRDDFAAPHMLEETPAALWEEADAPPDPSIQDELNDEFLCPYCAVQTDPADKRCKACGGKLWVKFRKDEKRSVWLWIAIASQALTTLQALSLPVVLLLVLLLSRDPRFGREFAQLLKLFNLTRAEMESGVVVALVLTSLYFLFSAAVLIALFVRWRPAYWMFVGSATLGLFLAIAGFIMSFSPNPEALPSWAQTTPLKAIGNVLFNGVRLWMFFQMQGDFEVVEARILFRPDRGLSGGPMFMARGQEYIRRKMWGLAALHFQRGVALLPDRVEGWGRLILLYIKLQRYDLATRALAAARRVLPNTPEWAELQATLDEARPAG